MSETLAKWSRLSRGERKSDRARGDDLSPGEQKALDKLRAEAKERGATLASGGKGGLPPSLVLGVVRRDRFRCKRCGSRKMLTLHHKAGATNLVGSALRKKGHSNDPANLVTLCDRCHDDIHEEDRAVGEDNTNHK